MHVMSFDFLNYLLILIYSFNSKEMWNESKNAENFGTFKRNGGENILKRSDKRHAMFHFCLKDKIKIKTTNDSGSHSEIQSYCSECRLMTSTPDDHVAKLRHQRFGTFREPTFKLSASRQECSPVRGTKQQQRSHFVTRACRGRRGRGK